MSLSEIVGAQNLRMQRPTNGYGVNVFQLIIHRHDLQIATYLVYTDLDLLHRKPCFVWN